MSDIIPILEDDIEMRHLKWVEDNILRKVYRGPIIKSSCFIVESNVSIFRFIVGLVPGYDNNSEVKNLYDSLRKFSSEYDLQIFFNWKYYHHSNYINRNRIDVHIRYHELKTRIRKLKIESI
jgi:hypothetical protein